MSADDDRLASIEQRLAPATPGPWLAANEKTGRRGVALVGVADRRGQGAAGCIAVLAGGGDLWKTRNADADLIAHAPDDLRWLIERLRLNTCTDPDCTRPATTQRRERVGREVTVRDLCAFHGHEFDLFAAEYDDEKRQ